MGKQVLLNNVMHSDLKVITDYSSKFGSNVNQVLIFPSEFSDIQREYPIFICKDSETGEYQPVALLGFDRNENLFLEEKGWTSSYIPAVIMRGPFLIGLQENLIDGEIIKEPMIYIDLADPRVSKTEGTPIFLPHGGKSTYLDRIVSTLNIIHSGIESSKKILSLFNDLGIIEPINIEVIISETEKYYIRDYYSINQKKLSEIKGKHLEQLNQSGFLMGAYMIVSSQANISRLIEIKKHKSKEC